MSELFNVPRRKIRYIAVSYRGHHVFNGYIFRTARSAERYTLRRVSGVHTYKSYLVVPIVRYRSTRYYAYPALGITVKHYPSLIAYALGMS